MFKLMMKRMMIKVMMKMMMKRILMTMGMMMTMGMNLITLSHSCLLKWGKGEKKVQVRLDIYVK